MSRKILLLLVIVLIALTVKADYIPPSPDDVILLLRETTPPEPDMVILYFNQQFEFNITYNSTTITGECLNVSIYHSQNLSCQVNATSNELALSWTVNDSRITIVNANDTAYLVDNPNITDYNLPGCWNIVINASGNSSSDLSNLTYCIDNHRPSFTQNCTSVHLFHNQNLSCQFNATDLDSDILYYFVNDSRVNVTGNGSIVDNASLADYNMPGGWLINITVSDTLFNTTQQMTYFINNTVPRFAQNCTTVHLYHNQNLSCQFNSTDNENDQIFYYINDSRVNITQDGYVVDNASFSDYNMPGGWLLNITISDTLFNTSRNMTYLINDTAPTFNEHFTNFSFYNDLNYSISANFTDNETDAASLTINCTQLNATVFNDTSSYNLSRISSSENSTFRVCLLTISDTRLNSTMSFTVNITQNPGTVASYTITLGANMSALHPRLVLYFNQTDMFRNLTNSTDNIQENMTATNPFYRINNTDDQLLKARCSINQTVQGYVFRVATNFTGNKTNMTINMTDIYLNVSPNQTINVYPFFDLWNYNFTLPRNDTATLSCDMAVP